MMDSAADDEFGANPFRSGGGGADFLGGPPPQQHQQFNQQHPPQMQFQQQHQFQMQQQFQPQGVGGPFVPQQQQQFQQAQPNPNHFQSPFMSGPMDNQMDQQRQMQQQQGMAPRSWWGSCMMCISLDSYRAYFDIDADDIVLRMKSAVLDFYKPDYFRNEVIGAQKTGALKGPDLYGPFWITMTLIFFVAVTGNVHAYLYRNDVAEFEYDINHLLHASTILCTYAFVIPSVLWTTTQCMSMQALLLVDWVCIYGYSLVPYLGAVVACVLPLGVISWIALLLATMMSVSLVVRNVAAPLLSSDVGQAKAPPLIMAILGTHLIFLFFMKFSFYHRKK